MAAVPEADVRHFVQAGQAVTFDFNVTARHAYFKWRTSPAMFLGTVWRKQKRKVLLLALRATQKTSSMSIWRPPLGNVSYRESNWLQAVEGSHSSFCGCGDFILHLTNLAARFALQGPPPEGNPPRPKPPLLRALPAPEVRRETRTKKPGRLR